MKRIIVMAIGISLLGAGVQSCKKGENDPALSLKSRKSRVAGEWTVSSSEQTKTDNSKQTIANPNTGQPEVVDKKVVSTYIYNGAIQTNTTTTTYASYTPNVTTSTEAYTATYVFEKDGTFTYTTTGTGKEKDVVTGTWNFLGKNKSAELKNKEAIMLTILNTTSTDEDGESTTYAKTGLETSMIFVLDQLKSKEIVIKNETSYTNPNNVNGTSVSTITLTAK